MNAPAILSQYLSKLLRAEIQVPAYPRSKTVAPATVARFIDLLPKVVTIAVDGEEQTYDLPLAFQGRGTTLAPPVATVVNCLMVEAANGGPMAGDIVVPTFYYPDGSSMAIRFIHANIAAALVMIEDSEAIKGFINVSLASLKNAESRGYSDRG